MACDYAFEINNLSFSYDGASPVIDGIDLRLAKGKITAVLGANGCGKSTLFRLLARALKPDAGEILLYGQNIGAFSRREFAKKVAVVHQYNVAPEDMTVEKLVSLGRTPYHGLLSERLTEEDRARIRAAMEITDTEKYANRPVRELSGGQRQRVWLALALAQDAEILLLDELTTYLDIYYQLELLRLIRELNARRGMTVLAVLHDINQALRCADVCVLMKDGKVLSQGPPADALTGKTIESAFGVTAALASINGKKYCVFE